MMREDNIGCVMVFVAIVCIVLSIAIAILVANADIPLWLKFLLLK